MRVDHEQQRDNPSKRQDEYCVGFFGDFLVKAVEADDDKAVYGNQCGVPQGRSHQKYSEMHDHLANGKSHGPLHHEVRHKNDHVVDAEVEYVVYAKADYEDVGCALQVSVGQDDKRSEDVTKQAPQQSYQHYNSSYVKSQC